MRNRFSKAFEAVCRRPALIFYTLAFLLPILSVLVSLLGRVLVAKGDFSVVFTELEFSFLGTLRAMRESDSISAFFSTVEPSLRAEAFLLSLSPLNLPMLIAPLTSLHTAATISFLLRLGFAGLSLSFFLRKIGCSRIPTLALSIVYALSSYALVSSAYPAYLDLMILFPFVVFGILRIARGRGGALYAAALGLSIILCPAAVSSLVIFSILLYVYFRIVAPCRNAWGSVAVFSGAVILALLASLSVLFTFLSISRLSPSEYPFKQAHDFLDFAAKLLPGSFDGASDAHFPYLSVGVLPIILSTVFFSSKAISLRLRIATGGLWFLLYFTFTISAINGVYSLFNTAVPVYAHAYIFPFLLTACAAYAWRCLSAEHERTIILSSGVVVLFAMILQKLNPTYEVLIEDIAVEYGYISKLAILWIPMLAAILFTAALSLIAHARTARSMIPRSALTLLIAAVCLEGALSSYALLKMAQGEALNSDLADADYTDAFSDSILSALELTDDDELYRVISSSALTDDDGLYFGYHSLTALPEPILESLGIELDDQECFTNADYPLALSLLGVRHYIERIRIQIGETKDGEPVYEEVAELPDEIRRYFDAGYTVLGDEEEGTTLLESSLALPMLFASHSALDDLTLSQITSPIALINEYFRKALGDDSLSLYEALPPLNIFGTKVDLNLDDYTIYSGSRLRMKTTVLYETPLYFSISTKYPRESTVSITANGITTTYPLYQESDTATDVTVPLGVFEKDTIVEVAINFPNSSDGRFYLPDNTSFLWQENSESAKQAIERLASRGAKNLSLSGDTLSFTIETSGESAILTTLPANSCLVVSVDGKRVEAKEALGAFLAIPISGDGEHRITLTVSEPIGVGSAVASVLGSAAILAVGILELLVCRNKITLPYLSERKEEDTEVADA